MRVALLALINKKNQIFMCLRRKDTIDFPDLWELPGGSVDDGETPIECAVRECQEELQITVPIDQCNLLKTYHGDHRNKPIDIHVFYAAHFEIINPVFGEGQQAWCWMGSNDIWNYPHIPANKIILGDLLKLRIAT